jgi:hypothetical protein
MASYFPESIIKASLNYFNDGGREIILRGNGDGPFLVQVGEAGHPEIPINFSKSYATLADAQRKFDELVNAHDPEMACEDCGVELDQETYERNMGHDNLSRCDQCRKNRRRRRIPRNAT